MDHYTSLNVQHRIVAKNHTSLLLQHAYATLAAEMAEKALNWDLKTAHLYVRTGMDRDL